MKNEEKASSPGRFFVLSLAVTFFSTWIIESLTGVFLVDVATTFFGSSNPVALATTGQLVTISSIVSVIFAVLLGFLSVSQSHKRLLLIGSFSVTLGILGCFFAPDFLFMQFFFSIEGIGTVVVGAMAFTLCKLLNALTCLKIYTPRLTSFRLGNMPVDTKILIK